MLFCLCIQYQTTFQQLLSLLLVVYFHTTSLLQILLLCVTPHFYFYVAFFITITVIIVIFIFLYYHLYHNSVLVFSLRNYYPYLHVSLDNGKTICGHLYTIYPTGSLYTGKVKDIAANQAFLQAYGFTFWSAACTLFFTFVKYFFSFLFYFTALQLLFLLFVSSNFAPHSTPLFLPQNLTLGTLLLHLEHFSLALSLKLVTT